MGYEILTQPQIFTKRLTALGGIEGYVPPYIARYFTWTLQTLTQSISYEIPFTWTGLSHAPSEGYIVNIDGVVQPPPSYYVDVDRYILFFTNPIPAGKTIYLTQVGTIALSSTSYESLYAANLNANNLSAANVIIDNLKVKNQITDPLNVNVLSAENIIVNVNTSQPAVRITQRGTGNAILVEDSANPDSSPFVIDADGNVGIGTTTPTPGYKLVVQGSVETGSRIFLNGDGASYAWIGRSGTAADGQRVAIALIAPNDTGVINQIGFRANSQYVMRLINGNVGIGSNVSSNDGYDSPFSIAGKVPQRVLHVEGVGTNNRILQSSSDSNSPILQQDFTPFFIDSKTGIEVTDASNPFLVGDADSHALHFEKIVPIKPVNYWLTSSTIPTTAFTLSGIYPLQSQSEAYIVSVGGVIQPKTTYTINPTTRNIIFVTNVPANADVYVLQTLNPLLSVGYDVAYPTQVVSTISPGSPNVSLTGLFTPWRSSPFDYFVTVDGINQFPNGTPYTVFPSTSTLSFAGTIPGTFVTTVTRLPSAITQVGPLDESCFLAESFTWSFTTTAPQSVFSIASGPANILSDRACYLVNVGGILQVPDRYNVNPVARTVTFTVPVPADVGVTITQLAQPEFPIRYSTIFSLADDCNNTSNGQAEEVVRIKPGFVSVQGSFATSPPITIAGSSTTTVLPFSASTVIFNTSVACSATLPRPSQNTGRWIFIKNIAAFPIFSSSFNIQPINSVTPTNSLLTGTAGRWAQLQSNGTQWVVMAQGGA
jgi:hypothetical protein